MIQHFGLISTFKKLNTLRNNQFSWWCCRISNHYFFN